MTCVLLRLQETKLKVFALLGSELSEKETALLRKIQMARDRMISTWTEYQT